jgi:ArsR family transcriptional regulator, arsenate/arsenite/antimonite-responsive transcriptional repressor
MNLDKTEIFKVLGVESRIKIIELLKSKGTMCSKDIAEELSLSQAAISQHLKILRMAGIVKRERKGYWIPYSIVKEVLENCCCRLVEVCTCGCDTIDDLKEQEIETKNLESLIKYKEELEKKIIEVKEMILKIKTKKKQ